MRFCGAQQHGLSNAHSPFRVVEQTGGEVEWVNRYLDQERVRGVADSSLRSYAHDLLHFLRWWAAAHKTSTITKEALTESTLLDYIRFESTGIRPLLRKGATGAARPPHRPFAASVPKPPISSAHPLRP